MMQIITCDECGGSDIAFDAVSVNVELNKSKLCDKCYSSNTKTQRYFFCSEKCFRIYIQKVAKGESKFEWQERHAHIS